MREYVGQSFVLEPDGDEQAELPAIRLHDARHSYATAARAAGIPIEVVSRRLGPARTSITSDVYSHVTPKADDEAAARVAASILGLGTG